MSKLKEKVLKLVKDKKFIAGFILIIAAFAIFAINNQDPTTITVYGDIFYLKNNKLYTANVETGQKGFVADLGTTQNESIKKVYNAVYAAKDKSGIIVPSDIKNTEEGVTLFYSCKKGTALIDEKIKTYSSSVNIEAIAYVKGENNELYLWKEGKRELIAENVAVVYLSENGESLSYYTYGKSVYLKETGKDSVLISENAILEYFGDNIIYYIEDGSLYKYNGAKELIDTSVATLKSVGINGDILYLKERKEIFTYKDIILDKERITEESSAYDKWKDVKIEKYYYTLIYRDRDKTEIITDRFRFGDTLRERKIGDHIRKAEGNVSLNFSLDKNFEDGIYVYGNKGAEFVKAKLDGEYGGYESFKGNYSENVVYPYKKSVMDVIMNEGEEYYVKRPSRGYLSLFYKNGSQDNMVDSLVGRVSVTNKGDAWYLKGRGGEKLELYSLSGANKSKIASGIEDVFDMSDVRTREFYEFTANKERLSQVLDLTKISYISPDMTGPNSYSYSGGSFCGTVD
ncbi:MAG: hypothetical protein J6M16_11270 [Clostridia bacterium]|nr:hypothetical protein [Clostridia bacterium]